MYGARFAGFLEGARHLYPELNADIGASYRYTMQQCEEWHPSLHRFGTDTEISQPLVVVGVLGDQLIAELAVELDDLLHALAGVVGEEGIGLFR